MKDFEVSAEPVQNWLSKAEKAVHENSNRLYDLPAKRREQQKLQVMRHWAHMATPLTLSCVQPAFRSPSAEHPGIR